MGHEAESVFRVVPGALDHGEAQGQFVIRSPFLRDGLFKIEFQIERRVVHGAVKTRGRGVEVVLDAVGQLIRARLRHGVTGVVFVQILAISQQGECVLCDVVARGIAVDQAAGQAFVAVDEQAQIRGDLLALGVRSAPRDFVVDVLAEFVHSAQLEDVHAALQVALLALLLTESNGVTGVDAVLVARVVDARNRGHVGEADFARGADVVAEVEQGRRVDGLCAADVGELALDVEFILFGFDAGEQEAARRAVLVHPVGDFVLQAEVVPQ